MKHDIGPTKINIAALILTAALSLFLLTGCVAENTTSDKSTPKPTPVTAWGLVEDAIRDAVLGLPTGKCEWQVLGWDRLEYYIWAFCQAGPEVDAAAVSAPAVVNTDAAGNIKSVTIPDDGKGFGRSVRKLFPPAIQEQVINIDFDLFTAVTRLESRWKNASVPPAIFAKSGESLPRLGLPVTPGISADNAKRIEQVKKLGEGNIRKIQILPNNLVVIHGDRGIGFLTEQSRIPSSIRATQTIPEESKIGEFHFEYLYQELLKGRPGFLSPDGTRLAVIDKQDILIFDTEKSSQLITLHTGDLEGEPRNAHFLADGLSLLVEKIVPGEGAPSTVAALFNLANGEFIRSWETPGWDMIISSNGYYAATLHDPRGLKIWLIGTGELLRTLPIVASAASFSGDGQRIAVLERGEVVIYWVWDGFEMGRINKSFRNTSGVAFSPDGELLLTWSEGKYYPRIWRTSDLQEIEILQFMGASSAAFSQDGQYIAIAGTQMIGIYLVDQQTWMYLPTTFFSRVDELAFAPDRSFSLGQRLAVLYTSTAANGIVANWDVETTTPIFIVPVWNTLSLGYAREPFGIAVGRIARSITMLDPLTGSHLRQLDGFSAAVQDISMNENDQLAASSMSQVRFYSLNDPEDTTGSEVLIQGGWVDAVTWACQFPVAVSSGIIKTISADGESQYLELPADTQGYVPTLAATSDCSQLFAAVNTTVYHWRMDTWELLPAWSVPDTITSFALSQDGSLAAVGLVDGSIHLLDTQSGKELKVLKGHVGAVNALDFSPDGSMMASGGDDGVVLLWGSQ